MKERRTAPRKAQADDRDERLFVNPRAEASVLGAILLRNEAMAIASEMLTVESFGRHANQIVFAGMLRLWQKRAPIDLVTLVNELGTSLPDANVAYIASLIDGVPRTTNVEHYAGIVGEMAGRRALVRATTEARVAAHDRDLSLSEAAAAAMAIVHPSVPKPKLVEPAKYTANFRKWWNDAESRFDRRVSTGFASMDSRMSGGLPVGLTVLAARPSIGKTALALSVAHAVGIGDMALNVLFVSGEMNEQQMTGRLVAMHAKLVAEKVIAGSAEVDPDEVDAALCDLEESSRIVFDFQKLTPTQLRATAMRMKSERGLNLIIVDYVQLMPPEPRWIREGMKRYEQLGKQVAHYKDTGMELDVPVLVLAQLSRESTKRKEPTNEDIRESGDIEQHADVIWLLNRKHGEQDATIIMSKQRNGQQARVPAWFVPDFMHYVDVGSAHHAEREY